MPSRLVVCALALAISVPFASTPLAAQAAAPEKQIISISPLSIVFGVFGAEYERRLSPSTSFGVSGSYWSPGDFSYTSVEGKYRYYPDGKALRGFGIGGTAGLARVGADDELVGGSRETASALSLGVTLDYQWLLGEKQRFAVALGGGAKRLFVTGDGVDGASLYLPSVRISIGRSF